MSIKNVQKEKYPRTAICYITGKRLVLSRILVIISSDLNDAYIMYNSWQHAVIRFHLVVVIPCLFHFFCYERKCGAPSFKIDVSFKLAEA